MDPRTHPPGTYPDFTQVSTVDNNYVTPAQNWLMDMLLALDPKGRNGGQYADKPGYHNTRRANRLKWPGNYSVRDAVDLAGPDDKTAAFDWTFIDAQAGDYRTFNRFMGRIIASADDPDDPRLNGWREFYGQADSDLQVEGRDTRYFTAATSDPSHLWHLHGSEDRDKVESYWNKWALLTVLMGWTTEQWQRSLIKEEDMALTDVVYTETLPDGTRRNRTVGNILGTLDVIVRRGEVAQASLKNQVAQILAEVVGEQDNDITLTDAQVEHAAQAIAARLPNPAAIADAVLDEHAARLQA